MQSPMLIHFAITPDKATAFESCLFGTPTIKLRDKTTGAAWLGASTSWYLETELTDGMGHRKACLASFSAWYSVAAYKLQTGVVNGVPVFTEFAVPIIVENNCGLPTQSPDQGFAAFLAACNLELISNSSTPPATGGGNGTISGNGTLS